MIIKKHRCKKKKKETIKSRDTEIKIFFYYHKNNYINRKKEKKCDPI